MTGEAFTLKGTRRNDKLRLATQSHLLAGGTFDSSQFSNYNRKILDILFCR
jgi:hypothetical protein